MRERIDGYDSTTRQPVSHYPPSPGFSNEVRLHQATRVTCLIVPIHAGAGDPTATVEVYYLVNGVWRRRNPGGTGNLNINEANVITSEDVVLGMRVVVAKTGTNPDPDGGWDIEWNIERIG